MADPRLTTLIFKQRETLLTLIRMTREQGHPPTIRELGVEWGVCYKAAHYRLLKLEAKGFLTLGGFMQARAIALTPAGQGVLLPDSLTICGEEVTRVTSKR